MLTGRSKFSPCDGRRGVALVLVLAFIVLLTGLLVAFFARVTNERTVANSSSNTDKADLLARSALDVIVGDLKQEIAAGSTATSVTAGGVTSTIYTPTSPANAVPVRSAEPATIPNLIRRSVRPPTTSGPTPAPTPSNASPVNSTDNVSANGRSVSLARWNSHLLIPRKNPGAASTDNTPIADFKAPDWVLVSRNGPHNEPIPPLTLPSATPPLNWESAMSDPSPNNQNFIVGRYAYAIYDEGGLLDANVAGYPSQTTVAQIGHKGRASFADLTQLKDPNPTNAFALTQTQVDNLIGWRNHASVQPGGTFPSFDFTDPHIATRYFNLVTGTLNGLLDPTNKYPLNGFLMVPPATLNGQTDQAFLDRQQLIELSHTLGIAPDILQYLGTFSRDLEQPSFAPNMNRPGIQSNTGVTNNNQNVPNFGTGNNAYGQDVNQINPALLSVRVASSFTRIDGSTAIVGEPMIKKRFPLSRLALVTYTATANKLATDPIYRSFGLYRNSASDPWQYDHGGSTRILRLSEITGREPDFFELLKTTINVGSLGKGECYNYNGLDQTTINPPSMENIQQIHDTQTDLQVLQIGANITDQYDTDSYPTRIAFAGATSIEVRGVENLPYMYRLRCRVVRESDGTGTVYLVPELWNPHAPLNSATYTGATPKNFKFRVVPTASTSGTFFSIKYFDVITNPAVDFTADPPLTFSAGETNGFNGFREPTVLSVIGAPSNPPINLAGGTPTGEYPPQSPARTLTGYKFADFLWHGQTSKGQAHDVSSVSIGSTGTGGVHPPVVCYLDLQDSFGNFVTYDQQVTEWYGANMDVSNNIYNFDLPTGNRSWWGGVRTDPRTSRWGTSITEYLSYLQPFDTQHTVYPTQRPTAGASWGAHIGAYKDNGITEPNVSTGTQYRGNRSGYWTENSIRDVDATDAGTLYPHYTRDPDGIPRRSMGGYASDPNNGGTYTTQAVGLPMVTANGNYQSRPIILNRPFTSVAELGYVFRDTPWSNLDMSFPESGDAGLLDVFCLDESQNPSALVAGRVDVNTRQQPVIQALLAGGITDDTQTPPSTLDPTGTTKAVANLAKQLITRTTGTSSTTGPLANRSELVGRWSSTATSSSAATTLLATDANPDNYYSGFSSDIGAVPGFTTKPEGFVPRLREVGVRSLVDSTTARTWNLLIDLVAQTGRYPSTAAKLSNFVVEGERHYWLHVAIDRATGTVLDTQLESVNQ